MNVQLTIGSQDFHLSVADAAKVMEILGKAKAVEGYWISGGDNFDSQSGVKFCTETRLAIEQIRAEPITKAEYEARREMAAKRREEEKA